MTGGKTVEGRTGQERPTSDERGDGRSRSALATLAALLVVPVGLVGVVLWPAVVPGTDGPLDASGETGVVIDSRPAGSTVTWGLQVLVHSSPDHDLVLREVTLDVGDPPVRALGEPMIAGPDRVDALGFGMIVVEPGWPPRDFPGLRLEPVAGATLPAGSRDALEVMVPVEVPSVEAGIGFLDGFTVEYEAGGRVYRERTRTILVMCPVENRVPCDEYLAERDAR